MDQEFPEPRKEEVGKSNQAWEYAYIQINLKEKDTYTDVEGFGLFSIEVEQKIIKPETIGANTTEIERPVLGGTDKH